MNDLQKIIIESIINNHHDYDSIIQDLKQTFTVTTLCQIMSIDRNRYYYLISINQLDTHIKSFIKSFIANEYGGVVL